MDSKLQTPNSELRTLWERGSKFTTLPFTLDEVLSRVQSSPPRKVLFWGEGAGEISSYVAGWMAGRGIQVIVLDGANRFNAYTVSSFARRTLLPPEKLLKSIRIARAFTCYQMATLMGEQLASLLRREGATEIRQRPWVILLGPLTTFLDEDVPEREVRPLFERSLRKIEGMASGGVPFLLFQSHPPSPPRFRVVPTLRKGGEEGWRSSKRAYLMRRLFQFSNEAWRIDLGEEEPKMIASRSPLPAGERDRVRGVRTRSTSDGADSPSF
jgi:hypothetical protein